jgi:transposase
MTKKRRQFCTEEITKLKDCAEASSDMLARDRCRAVYLYGSGYPVREILEQIGCSRTTLMDWCRSFRHSGIDGLLDHRRGGNRARLTAAQLGDLKQHLKNETNGQHGWTVETLEQLVYRWYGVRYKSRTSYHSLFEKCGFKFNRQLDKFMPDTDSAPST